MKVKTNTLKKNCADTMYVTYDAIEKCTNCNKAMVPQKLYSIIIEKEEDYYFYVADFCGSCRTVLISEYKLNKISLNTFVVEKPIRTYPQYFEEERFDENINEVSPQFINIYNQAMQAEKMGLDQIAGLGYRKSIEFLIKDFAIYQNPECKEDIKSIWMKKCIDNYIDDPRIKTLAERADWIGNDEAHYLRKQEERDIEDMKRFIKAMVYFIGIILITDDAISMKSQK